MTTVEQGTRYVRPERVHLYKTVSIGLVSFRIGINPAFSSDSPSKVASNSLCPDHHIKVTQIYQCDFDPEVPHFMPKREVEKGYNLGTPKDPVYVTLTADEEAAIQAMTEEAISIDAWVEAIDPAWYDGNPYGVWQGNDSELNMRTFNTFVTALRERGGALVGKTADHGVSKQVAILYSPLLGSLCIQRLKYGDQLRQAQMIVAQRALEQAPEPVPAELEMLNSILDGMAESEYNMDKVVDEVALKKRELLEKKQQGGTIVAVGTPDKVVEPADLMEALRKTVAAMPPKKQPAKPKAKPRAKKQAA